MKFQNINLYFNSKCCISNPQDETLAIGQSPLSDLCPKNCQEHLDQFTKLKNCDLQEICITYKPVYHLTPPIQLYNKTKDWILAYLYKYDYFEPYYYFVPEFNASGVLHFHGIIYFNNANDYWVADFKRKLNNKFGRTMGKKVFNLDNYWTYMTKDIKKTKFSIKPFGNIKKETTYQRMDISKLDDNIDISIEETNKT